MRRGLTFALLAVAVLGLPPGCLSEDESGNPAAGAGQGGDTAAGGRLPASGGASGGVGGGNAGAAGAAGESMGGAEAPTCVPSPGTFELLRETLLPPVLLPNLGVVTAEIWPAHESTLLLSEPELGQVAVLTGCPESCDIEVIDQDLVAPVGARALDFDDDDDIDLLVADIGVLLAVTDPVGRVVWLERTPSGFETHVLAEGIGRVACAEAADLDGDGDQDVVVCEFGAAEGSFFWLEQTAPGSFERRTLLLEAGALSALPTDEDGDGDVDLLTAMSQDAQRIDLYENDGSGNFTRRTIFQAPGGSFGLGAVEHTDLDRDGDLDVLLLRGDYLDDTYELEGQGLSWLERRPNGTYAHHDIVLSVGAYAATTLDLDRDCDEDIVLGSFLEPAVLGEPWSDLPGLMWLENDGNQNFSPHVIEDAPTRIISLGSVRAADGTPAILIGSMALSQTTANDARLEALHVVPN